MLNKAYKAGFPRCLDRCVWVDSGGGTQTAKRSFEMHGTGINVLLSQLLRAGFENQKKREVRVVMKRMIKSTLLAGALLLFSGTASMWAQPAGGPPGGGPGGFDPAQMQQRMMDRMREQLDVKSDDEWKLIQTRIEKVMAARREAGGMGMGMGGMMGPRRQQQQGQDNQNANANNQQRRQRGGMFGPQTPNPEAEALQKAIEAKAGKEDIKAKLDAYRASMKTREAALEKAQADLQQVLSVNQEAQAVLMGLLK